MISVIYKADCHFAACRYSQCYYADRYGALLTDYDNPCNAMIMLSARHHIFFPLGFLKVSTQQNCFTFTKEKQRLHKRAF
jgi:hypothetical protein